MARIYLIKLAKLPAIYSAKKNQQRVEHFQIYISLWRRK